MLQFLAVANLSMVRLPGSRVYMQYKTRHCQLVMSPSFAYLPSLSFRMHACSVSDFSHAERHQAVKCSPLSVTGGRSNLKQAAGSEPYGPSCTYASHVWKPEHSQWPGSNARGSQAQMPYSLETKVHSSL